MHIFVLRSLQGEARSYGYLKSFEGVKWIETRTALFWVVTQRVMVIPYRRFGIICRSYLKGSRILDP